ncbi:MAG: hypothetical protein ABSF70_14735 [Terracidiphilus sp.]|jgi:hypothetical protein
MKCPVRLIVPAMLAALALPCMATQRVTVEQLQQTLAAQRAADKSDGYTAEQLGKLELTEQLTEHTYARITAELKPGPKTLLALKLLADLSVFLEPPASELPDRAPPTAAEQRSMWNGATNYVGVTLRHMPNFLATRLTQRYDDSPLMSITNGLGPYLDLHLTQTFSQQIAYRDGEEVAASKPTLESSSSGFTGYTSKGEFGPILATILVDTSKGKVTWSHWEQTASGQVAVFHYAVPQAASHYSVDFCCVQNPASGALAFGFAAGTELASNTDSYRGTPGYHGNVYLDPATGAILRITMDTELKASDPIKRVGMSVEYGPVEIGGKNFILPVHSIAIMLARSYLGGTGRSGSMNEKTILSINEVSFSEYHRFGSTMRLITDAPQ